MNNTKELLDVYLDLYDVPKRQKKTFFESKAIQLYIYLRDKLPYTDLIELQIVLNNIYYGQESEKKINFNEYLHVEDKYIKDVCTVFELDKCPRSKKTILAILGSIIAMEPQEVVVNYLLKGEVV
jgi:hypothetical protein